MKEKRLYKLWTIVSRILAATSIALMTVWLLHYVTEPAYKGHDLERFVREMVVTAICIAVAALAGNIALWHKGKVMHEQSIVHQQYQRQQLRVEDRRMRMNINIR